MKKQNNRENKNFYEDKNSMEIVNKILSDDKCKKEYNSLIKSLQDYLASQPDAVTCAKKIRLIKRSIQRRKRKEKGKLLKFDDYDLSTLKKMRNEIVHNRKINDMTLIEFGDWLWKIIGFIYSDDVQALFNTLSYFIQADNNDLQRITPRSSVKRVTKYFKEIYVTRESAEKASIIRNLIPMIYERLDQKMKNNSLGINRK